MASHTHRIRRTAHNTQYTYNLNRRIHDVKTYPVLSPQGATILIYGHENGLTLIWRGGRRLKPTKRAVSNAKRKQNGGGGDAVMILDSDEDTASAPATAAFVDKPEFEDAGSEAEDAYPEIIQTLDLALGTSVLHVAVLPMTPCAAEDAGPDFLQHNMAFVVTCATSDVFVITLPLTPPSHESKERLDLQANLLAGSAGKGKWGETIIPLGGQGKTCDGVAMALVKQRMSSKERSKSPSRTRQTSTSPVTRVIVAACSREASGTLRLWDVPLSSKATNADRSLAAFQTEYLPSPLIGITFNPIHITQLLAIASPHAVRIYDYSVPSVPQDDVSEGPFPTQGSWLLSLYPPFARGSLTSTARKPIVAAAWVAHGRAVLTLLADGQWGIWDIDGAGPLASGGTTQTLFSKTGAGVRGAALTSFSATGQLEGTSPIRNPASRKSEGDFVPMTPHTRRDALATSFAGGIERLAAVRGGVEVVQLPTLRGGSGDETAVLWLGTDHIVAVIPGVSRFWDAQVRKSSGGGVNLFSGAQPSRMIRQTDLNVGLMGERCYGVGAVARFPRRHNEEDGAGEGLPIEVLIQGESRLVVVRGSEDGTTLPVNSGLFAARKRKLGPTLAVEPASAIVVHPRRDKAATVSFDLSVNKRGSLREPQSSQESTIPAGSFASSRFYESQPHSQEPYLDEVTMTQSMMYSRTPEHGFGFVNDLEDAVDAEDDEEAAGDRNVEEEMLDVMEIDRALEEMEHDRHSGAKHVFFETG